MSLLHFFTFNLFSENTYIVADAAGEAAIIDPGCMDVAEQRTLEAYIRTNGLKPVLLLNTHCHIDHVLGNRFVYDTYGLQPWIHPADEKDLNRLESYGPVFGIQAMASPAPAGYLKDGEEVAVGKLRFELREAPGHSAGSICFVNHEEGYVISGDVLFAGSIGRTDLPGGDYATLIASVKSQLFTLPNEMKVYPGHGGATTIGWEKQNNPFFQ